MSGTLAVYRKELASYFRSPIAYFVVAVFLLGTGYFFLYNVFLTGEPRMAGTFQNMGMLLADAGAGRLHAPARRGARRGHRRAAADATAHAVADRGRQVPGRGDDLAGDRRRHPASTWCRSTCSATPETTTIVAGYLGFVLLGMACLAIGLLFSALTHNQIVAALLTAAVLLALLVRRPPADVPALAGRCGALVGYLSFALHFADFIQGLVRTEAVAFFLIVSAVAADAERRLPPVAPLTWSGPFRGGADPPGRRSSCWRRRSSSTRSS